MSTRIEGDVFVAGRLQASTLVPSSGSVSDAHIAAAAAIASSKTVHRHAIRFNQANSTATAETRPLHVVYGVSGTVVDFRAGSIAPCTGNATITLDLKKNGASILSAPIVLDNTNAARTAEAASVASAALVAGDWLEVVVTVNAGTGALGTGLLAELLIDEQPN